MTRMSTITRFTYRGQIKLEPGGSAYTRLKPLRFVFRAVLGLILYILIAAIILLANHITQAGESDQVSPADDQYAVAAGHYSQKQWELAAEEFTTFLENFPQHPKTPEGVYYLGESFLQSGSLENAQKRFEQYLSENPEGKLRREATFRAAETAYLSGNYKLAKQRLLDFKTENPKDNLCAFVLPYLGNIALAEKDSKAAADAFRTGLEQFPHGRLQDNCRLGLARALAMQGKPYEAGEIYQALAAKPASRL
ncbi:MAG: tetratricopeptide repeat protein, partial [Pirellulales bacterium]|nr:tetratricopeptide repeat protein [Pirellulales bacterium]